MGIAFDELEREPLGDHPDGARRWMIVSVVVLLVAAAVGIGFTVGRSTGDGVTSAPLGTVPTVDAAPEPTLPTTAPVSSVADVPVPVTTERLAPAATEVTTDSSIGADSDAGAMSSSGGPGYAAFGIGPSELLAERATPSGYTLRAHLGETWDDDMAWGPGDWQPAPWCYETGQLRIALAGNGAIDVGGVPWYRAPYQGRAVSWLSLGGIDGQPQWVVVAQTPPDTTSVSVTFADGATDTAAPQNGIALLAVPGVPATEVDDGGHSYWVQDPPVFEVVFEGGSAPATVRSDGTGSWDDPDFVAGCQPPPPALPEPGEQPDDAAAAQDEITHAMTVLYDSTELGEKDLYVDDPTGVGEAREEVATGPFAEQADSAQAVIEELVFTSPTEAWFRYRIETATGSFSARFGTAVDVDGVWKVTRDTVCQDLSFAGGTCVPGWTTIQPPGTASEVFEYTD